MIGELHVKIESKILNSEGKPFVTFQPLELNQKGEILLEQKEKMESLKYRMVYTNELSQNDALDVIQFINNTVKIKGECIVELRG